MTKQKSSKNSVFAGIQPRTEFTDRILKNPESSLQAALKWAKANPVKAALLMAGGAYILSHKAARKALFWNDSTTAYSSPETPKTVIDNIPHGGGDGTATIH